MKINIVDKKYGNHSILKNISFEMRKGEIIGLIGKNGVGKSTLMKIISRLDGNYEGDIIYDGSICYSIEAPKLYANKSAYWHLKYFSNIFGNSFNIDDYEKLFKDIELLEVLNKKVKKYSLGMKQKLGVCISLINNPEYIILDEPTNGMDVDTSIAFLREVQSIAKSKEIGVLVSSHKLEDIELICDKILLLNDGMIDSLKSTDFKNVIEHRLHFNNHKDLDLFMIKQDLGIVTSAEDNMLVLESNCTYTELIKFLGSLSIQLNDYSTNKKSLRNIYFDKFDMEGKHETK